CVFTNLECIELQLLELLQVVDKIEKRFVADDVNTLRVADRNVSKHQPQPSANRLFGKNVCLCRVGTKPDYNGYVLNIPSLPQHQHADNCIDRIRQPVDLSGKAPGGL